MAHAQSPFLYLTTTGRRTGLPREIEIWFTSRRGRYYLVAEQGERANWVRNIRAEPRVEHIIVMQEFTDRCEVVRFHSFPELLDDLFITLIWL